MLRVTHSKPDYYRTLIWPVTNQEPRKTIAYCFENNKFYCFPNPRWPPQKSLLDLFLIVGIIRSPIFVDPFPVVLTVLSLVISDVCFVLLAIGSLAAGEPFPVVFIPPFKTWFENLGVLGYEKRLCDQKQRKVRQNIVRIGAWDQESEKLETSLVPSDTLCETPTVKTSSCNHFSLWFSCCYYAINVINYASDSLFITISWHRYTPPSPVITLVLSHVISHTPYPCPVNGC